MPFELSIALFSILVPAAVTTIAIAAGRWKFQANQSAIFVDVAAGIIGAVAIWIAAGLRNGFVIWPSDSWSAVPIAAIVVAASLPTSASPSRWIFRSLAVMFATFLVLPGGEGFADLMPAMPRWQLIMSAAIVLSWWSLEHVNEKSILPLGILWITLMGAGTILVGQSFAKLAEIMLAIGAVWVVNVVMAAWTKRPKLVQFSAGPILMSFVAAVANGQFNSFLGFPDWLSWLTIISPFLVSLPCLLLQSTKKTWLPTVISSGLALLIVGVVVGYSMQSPE